MTGERACCGAGRPRGRLARSKPWLGALAGLAAVLAPKCPVCLAAYLSMFGVTVSATSVVAPLLRPLGVALLGAALGLSLTRRLRERRAAGR